MQHPSKHWDNISQVRPEILEAISVINFDSLCHIASELRKKPCKVNRSKCTYGGVNILFELEFDDLFWIARIRRPDESYPADGTDLILESEVATMRFLRDNTSIPVPAVYSFDSRFGASNDVGMPYILMEAMSGKRLYGGGRADFIPDPYKPKVYRQIVDFILQLYNLPFDEIGMLFFDDNSARGVRIAAIHDQNYRIPPYGPFTDSLEFYQTRCKLLSEYYHSKQSGQGLPSISSSIMDAEMPVALEALVDKRTVKGPFHLAHPDFQINNFLFDDEYTITALVDWSGCQTLPLESFARHPAKIIPDPDEFLDFWGDLLSPEMRHQWTMRRDMFLELIQERVGSTSELYEMMLSRRAYFANCLDFDGILGIRRWLPRKHFERFVEDLKGMECATGSER